MVLVERLLLSFIYLSPKIYSYLFDSQILSSGPTCGATE
jgi:hypothetical protein